jgi:hypothetical protein
LVQADRHWRPLRNQAPSVAFSKALLSALRPRSGWFRQVHKGLAELQNGGSFEQRMHV